MAEHKQNGTELTEEQILADTEKLYGRTSAFPGVLKTDNADEILKTLHARKAAQEKSK